MRKFVSGIVFAVLMAWLFLPFAAGEATATHACCRVHGEHHCADAQLSSGQPTVSARCPHHATRALFRTTTAMPGSRFSTSSESSVAVDRGEDLDRTVEHTSRASGRAPPTYLS